MSRFALCQLMEDSTMKRIYLTQYVSHVGELSYIITKLVNDVRYKVGEGLSRKEVEGLCALSEYWTVTITED